MGKNKFFIFCIIFMSVFSFIKAEGQAIRGYLTTGPWYPESKEKLNHLLDQCFLRANKKPVIGKIVGIIAPHAGLTYSGPCAASAYRLLQKTATRNQIKRIILLGISHRGAFHGAAVSTFTANTTPLGKITVDTIVTAKLAKEKLFHVNNTALQNEHSLEVQLPFLQKVFAGQNIKIVPILLGNLNREDYTLLANIIKKYINKYTLIIASTDLTHYGRSFSYTPFSDNINANLTKLDGGVIQHITNLDFDNFFAYKAKTGITMCGFKPVGVLIKLFSDKKYIATLTDYYKSGDINKDYTHSVSYASLVVTERGGETNQGSVLLTGPEKNTLLTIARNSLEQFLKTGNTGRNPASEFKVTESLKEVTGVFVTLKSKGHLRGCIGSIIGREPLFLGVRNNAINAAVRDNRFKPVRFSELKGLDIEISVMTPLQQISDYKQIKLGTDGVIIKKGNYQAVFLPQVATETGWDLDQFLSRLCLKAGLAPKDYLPGGNNKMAFFIFQAQVFGEE